MGYPVHDMPAPSSKMVITAEQLARAAHAKQVDKAGLPYVNHLERVVARLDRPEERIVGWLHDTIEDCSITAEQLLTEGFPAEVVDAVLAVTRHEGETPDDYYARVRANRLALAVKAADLADNSDPARLQLLPAETRERLELKYRHARTVLGLASQ